LSVLHPTTEAALDPPPAAPAGEEAEAEDEYMRQTVEVVVASTDPTGCASVREKHSWPWRSALISEKELSWAMEGQ
jgi:hypothetical protein